MNIESLILPLDALSWVLVLLAVVAGGVLRGLTGFGGALVMVPLMSIVLPPTYTVCVAGILNAASLRQALQPGVLAQADRRMLGPMLAGAALGLPLGIVLLHWVPSWLFAPLVGGVVVGVALWMLFSRGMQLRASGLRAGMAGGLSGVMTGFGGVGGPPAVLYVLGVAGRTPAAESARANFIVFFALLYPLALAALALSGVMGLSETLLGLLLVPLFLGASGVGTWIYGRTPQAHYRRLALAMMLLTGSTSIWVHRTEIAQHWCAAAQFCASAHAATAAVNKKLI